jgi:hypothetical protein
MSFKRAVRHEVGIVESESEDDEPLDLDKLLELKKRLDELSDPSDSEEYYQSNSGDSELSGNSSGDSDGERVEPQLIECKYCPDKEITNPRDYDLHLNSKVFFSLD